MVERSGTDEFAVAADDLAAGTFKRGQRVTGQDVPHETTSADLARQFVKAALDAAGHIPATNDRAQAALGLVGVKLAYACEENGWVREWLTRQIRSMTNEL